MEKETKQKIATVGIVGALSLASYGGMFYKFSLERAERDQQRQAGQKALDSLKVAAEKEALASGAPLRLDLHGNVLPAVCVPTQTGVHCSFDIPKAEYQRNVKADVDNKFTPIEKALGQ